MIPFDYCIDVYQTKLSVLILLDATLVLSNYGQQKLRNGKEFSSRLS